MLVPLILTLLILFIYFRFAYLPTCDIKLQGFLFTYKCLTGFMYILLYFLMLAGVHPKLSVLIMVWSEGFETLYIDKLVLIDLSPVLLM